MQQLSNIFIAFLGPVAEVLYVNLILYDYTSLAEKIISKSSLVII